MTTLCTCNINNLFLRYKFGRTIPGGRANPSEEELLWGYLPLQKKGMFDFFKEDKLVLEAQALRLPDGSLPDVLCLQEVESLAALRLFNTKCLGSHYPYAALMDSHDMRQIDVGILSALPIVSLRSNMDTLDEEGVRDKDFPWLFSRDCLEATLALNASGSQTLTVFINHFKSKLSLEEDPQKRKKEEAAAAQRRLRQAEGVAKILASRFPGKERGKALFAVAGDLNDEPGTEPLLVLTKEAGLENVLDRLDAKERWTHFYSGGGQVSQFDYLLLSPALAKRCKQKPLVNRGGIAGSARSKPKTLIGPGGANCGMVDFDFERLPGVNSKLFASDHCPVTVSF